VPVRFEFGEPAPENSCYGATLQQGKVGRR
jgi:hypothetical protein